MTSAAQRREVARQLPAVSLVPDPEHPPQRGGWTAADIHRLPAAVPLATAGSILGLGRTTAHQLARAQAFPVPVIRVGRRYVVATSSLRHLLGLEQPTDTPEAPLSTLTPTRD